MKKHLIGVGGIICNADDHVLLVQRGADAPRFPEAWTLPTGFVDAGEDLVSALRREFREELGIKFTPEPTMFYAGMKTGITIYYFLGTWKPENEIAGIQLRPNPKGIMENDAFAFFSIPDAISLGDTHHFVFTDALQRLKPKPGDRNGKQ
jgi:ADP-ribose pyrophosphatase YjhB (NUDIX family)